MAVTEGTEGAVHVVGSDEAGKTLGALLAEVERGTLVVIVDRRYGTVRASLVPGYPRELVHGPGLTPAELNGSAPGGPA